MPALDFLVSRSDLRECRFATAPDPDQVELADGAALLRVDRFALTANNITYAVAGDLMSYWDFFPAEPGWGRVPVWGFGDVVRSRHDDLPVGERVFGYFPISTHLVVQVEHVTDAGFVDAADHRAALPPAYNRYSRVAADPVYSAEREDHQMLLWPLFMTSFVLDDFLADNADFGAPTVLVSSASSKTSMGLAFMLASRREPRPRVVGLTSDGNRDFVSGLGTYDEVVTYDQITGLSPSEPAVFVDMAGDRHVLRDVHTTFGADLAYSCQVGITHWEQLGAEPDLPGPTPQLFFAPSQIEKRTAEWGRDGLQRRFGDAWERFLGAVDDWVEIARAEGPEAVEAVYRDLLEGRSSPRIGHVLAL